MEFLNASENRIDLEGESPSLGLFVVFLQHVDVGASKVLPVAHRFFDPFGFRNLLSEDLEEGRLPAADVTFNGEAVVLVGELGVEPEVL
jgi:hypothetical protein